MCRIAHMHCPSAMESVVPYFTIKFNEKNGTAQGLCAQRPGRSFGFAASSRTSDGAGRLARAPLCLKKDDSEKTTFVDARQHGRTDCDILVAGRVSHLCRQNNTSVLRISQCLDFCPQVETRKME